MKLPLFQHGYQGKHERVEVPRQRDDEPEPRTADEYESGEEQETTPSGTAGKHARDGDARMPSTAAVAEALAGAARQDSEGADAPPERPGGPGRV